jgi:hypothetical protein
MEQVIDTPVANVQTEAAAQPAVLQELAPVVLEKIGGGIISFSL